MSSCALSAVFLDSSAIFITLNIPLGLKDVISAPGQGADTGT